MESLFTVNKDNADKAAKMLYDKYHYKKTRDFEFISLYPEMGDHIAILHPLHTGKLNFIIDDGIIDMSDSHYFIILPINDLNYSSEDDNIDIHMIFTKYTDLAEHGNSIRIFWSSKGGKMHIETGGLLDQIEIGWVFKIAGRSKEDIKLSSKYFSSPNLADVISVFNSMNINPDYFPGLITNNIFTLHSNYSTSKNEVDFDLYLSSPIFCVDSFRFRGSTRAHVYGADNIDKNTGSVDFGKAKIIR